MSGRLIRLTQKIVNKPQLMYAPSLEGVLQILTDRNNGVDVQLAVNGGRKRQVEELCFNQDTGVGVLSIDGPLTYLEYEPMCGSTPSSYQRLTSEFKAMVKAGAKTIVLDVDSPGGEAYACFETALSVRKMADDAGVKILAYVDGLAASAAYGLSCIADEIIVNPMAEVGSIGVVVGLTNYSEAEKKYGIQRTYVYAGSSKVPYDADGKFTESFLNDIQTKVDELYVQFVSHVADARKLSVETVKSTEAKVFTANKAVELGLADAVMTVEEFQNYLATFNNGETSMGIKSRLFSMTQEDDMSKVAELEAQVASMTAELATSAEKLESLVSENEKLTATLAEVEAQKAELAAKIADVEAAALAAEQAAAEAAKLAAEEARKARLEAAVGSEKAAELYTSLSVLDDAGFDSVVSTFEAAKTSVDSSVLFEEQGIGSDGNLTGEDAQLALVSKFINSSKSK